PAAACPPRRAQRLPGLTARGAQQDTQVGIGAALPGPVRATLRLRGGDRPTWQLRARADKVDTALLAGADEPGPTPLSLQLDADGTGGTATVQGHVEPGELRAGVRPAKLMLEDKVLACE